MQKVLQHAKVSDTPAQHHGWRLRCIHLLRRPLTGKLLSVSIRASLHCQRGQPPSARSLCDILLVACLLNVILGLLLLLLFLLLLLDSLLGSLGILGRSGHLNINLHLGSLCFHNRRLCSGFLSLILGPC